MRRLFNIWIIPLLTLTYCHIPTYDYEYRYKSDSSIVLRSKITLKRPMPKFDKVYLNSNSKAKPFILIRP